MTVKTIKEAVAYIMSVANIKNKQELDKWCGIEKREKLYKCVEEIAGDHWRRIQTPKDSTRYYYELILKGYKINKPTKLKI